MMKLFATTATILICASVFCDVDVDNFIFNTTEDGSIEKADTDFMPEINNKRQEPISEFSVTVSVSPINPIESKPQTTGVSITPINEIYRTEIPISIYSSYTIASNNFDDIELYYKTISALGSISKMIDVYFETVELTGESSKISINLENIIINSMVYTEYVKADIDSWSQYESKIKEFSVPMLSYNSMKYTSSIQFILSNPNIIEYLKNNGVVFDISSTPLNIAKKNKMDIYEFFATTLPFGATIGEISKTIINKRKSGLDTTQEERMVKALLQIEWKATLAKNRAREKRKIKHQRSQTNQPSRQE